MYWPDIIMGECCWYWSSSPVEVPVAPAWLVSFLTGVVDYDYVGYDGRARCVR